MKIAYKTRSSNSRSSSKDHSSVSREVSSDSQIIRPHSMGSTSNPQSIGALSSHSLPMTAPHSPSGSSNHRMPSLKGGDASKEKGLSKSVSTFFKSLFNSKASDNGGRVETAISALNRSIKSSKSFSAGKGLTVAIDRSKPGPAPASTHGQTPSSPTVHQGYHHADIASPLASSKSVTIRKPNDPLAMPPQQHINPPSASFSAKEEAPPSTLLAVSPVLPPKMARPVWCLKDYAIVEKMYTGYASTVYKAWCKLSGETVCLKAYNMGNLCELNRYQIFREVKLHSSLQHENIITLFGAFQQGDQVVLVQEFADSGDLFLLLHRYGGKLPEKTAVEMILHPFLNCLNYLHQNCIAHRDIKPENVLFTRTMQLKICDFGLAIDMREERAVTRAGTLEYMAPEVLDCPFKNKPEENKERQDLYYSLTVDAWAMGVLTYELLVGFPPFNDKQRAAIEDKIRTERPRFPSSMSENARSFVLRALQKDPVERPTANELRNHPWIQALKRSAPAPLKPALKQQQQQQYLAPKTSLEESISSTSTSSGGAGVSSPNGPMPCDRPFASKELRTDDGDLMKSYGSPSYLSFTAGGNQAKLPMLLSTKSKGVATAPTGSFTTANNPKLQHCRGQ